MSNFHDGPKRKGARGALIRGGSVFTYEFMYIEIVLNLPLKNYLASEAQVCVQASLH